MKNNINAIVVAKIALWKNYENSCIFITHVHSHVDRVLPTIPVKDGGQNGQSNWDDVKGNGEFVEDVGVIVVNGDVNKDDEKYISNYDSNVRDIDFEDNVDEKNDDDCFKNYVDANVIDVA